MDKQLSSGRVYYEIHGEGRPIVVLHGGPGDVGHMRGLMEPVFEPGSGWQRLYLDLPGYGLTQPNDTIDCYDRVLDFILEFIDDQLDGRQFTLAGYSYGGYLARGVVHQRPEQVHGLCLIVPRIMQDSSAKTVPEHQAIYVEPGFMEELGPGEEWIPDYLVIQTKAGLEAMRQHFLPALAHYDTAFSERLKLVSPGLSFDVDDLAVPFERPALIITGRQDGVTGYQDAWSLLDKYPRATHVILDAAGHFLGLVEQVSLFRALVREWLDRLAGEPE